MLAASAAKVPDVIKHEMDKVGERISDKFIRATGGHLCEIKNAGAAAVDAASAFNRAASLSQWKTAALAMTTSMLCVGVAMVVLLSWTPSLAEIRVIRAERDQMAAYGFKLESRGHSALVCPCVDAPTYPDR